jgi:hypothetical protein
MKKLTCPACGADLIEDAAETITEHEHGSITVDAFFAYVCSKKCGHFEHVPESGNFPQAIAQQGDDRLLLLYPNNQGRIYVAGENMLYPPKDYDAHLKFGYWDPYKGNHDIQSLVKNARYFEDIDLEPLNLFEFATSELSQDAFLCWFLQWAHRAFRFTNEPLHQTALQFIDAIFKKHDYEGAPFIEEIKIERQFQSLDILVLINKEYAILIEDKTYTSDHSNQLIRYRELVEEFFTRYDQLPIYYKIADQSHYLSCNKAGYKPFTRHDMLPILKEGIQSGVTNHIFLDYTKHLEQLDQKYKTFRTKPVDTWGKFDWHGFYQQLQQEINGGWGYVSNSRGGFQGFWWTPDPDQRYYIQLEETQLCIKIKSTDGEDRRALRTQAVADILNRPHLNELQFKKPVKFGLGKTMTIAKKASYIQADSHGLVDIAATIAFLKNLVI